MFRSMYYSLAERVGFEPTVPLGITGFQDQLLKPLGHLSASAVLTAYLLYNKTVPLSRDIVSKNRFYILFTIISFRKDAAFRRHEHTACILQGNLL